MTIRRILSLCLALALALCGVAALAEEDLQAQLDAANARIAELEAQVATYYPFYQRQIVATYGTDGIIWLEDVQAQYDAVLAQYQNSGLDLEAYGLADTVKRDIVDEAVKHEVLMGKAVELGLDQFDEDAVAGFETQAAEEMQDYIQLYLDYFYADAEEITDDMRAEAEAYWLDNGMTVDSIAESLRESATLDAVHDYATKDVAITEEDVQAAYEAMVESNKSDYADDRTYNSDRTSGVPIAWNPEGYRAVKHVLIMFDDAQAQRYSDLQSQLSSLNAERDAIENPPEDAAEDGEDIEGETEEAAKRTLSEVDADIAACGMEIESLYAELLPTAEEVIAAFNDGADFDELIEKYNQDPGMQNEPTASMGYAVAAGSTTWEQPFVEGAMSIDAVGQISDPVYGSNGIHIIYYMDDIQPGEVGLEAIRDSVETDALEQKISDAYDAQVDAWLEEANVEYHYENFGIAVAGDAEAAPDEDEEAAEDGEEAAEDEETAEDEEAAED